MQHELTQPALRPKDHPASQTSGFPGKHCILDAQGCCSIVLNDADLLASSLRSAVSAHGGTLIDLSVEQFEPQGVTIVALLAESHMSIHTWPEHGYAAIDAFTCGNTDPVAMSRSLASWLKATSVEIQTITRGPSQG